MNKEAAVARQNEDVVSPQVRGCGYDLADPVAADAGLAHAARAIVAGQIIVLPTDTVYGVGADARQASAVAALLAAKGRGRSFPPPVLIGEAAEADALVREFPAPARALARRFWPGALTLILPSRPELGWDLGDTAGTIALRMPDDAGALRLLRATGSLAVSSANRHGAPAALTCAEASSQLGDAVAVYLDGGTSRGQRASTIVDATGKCLRVVRDGAISRAQLVEVVGEGALQDAGSVSEKTAAEEKAAGGDATQ